MIDQLLRLAICLSLLGASAHLLDAQIASENSDATVATLYDAHGIDAWNQLQCVRCAVTVEFGGNRVIDGVFTFEAHGPRARYDYGDDQSVIFDGKMAYLSPETAVDKNSRFHVLTWPWFIMSPFKVKGEGITLSEVGPRPVNGKTYQSVYQTFGSDMGDSPDDWYRLFVDQEDGLLRWMSYIVTYGKSETEANQSPSIIHYTNYTETKPRIAQSFELWHWDAGSGTVKGETPKGFGQVQNIEFVQCDDSHFQIPQNSRSLELPKEGI